MAALSAGNYSAVCPLASAVSAFIPKLGRDDDRERIVSRPYDDGHALQKCGIGSNVIPSPSMLG
ncbi:hypothetical protein [Gloeocapsopsis dulcis]|uniref:hypothetical protein n=1 Tax=Gloeocapsopsis dulcis TaxID=2859516 RepID=UPI00399A4653